MNLRITLMTALLAFTSASNQDKNGEKHLRGRTLQQLPPNLPQNLQQKFNNFPSQAQKRIVDVLNKVNINAKQDGKLLFFDSAGAVGIEEPARPNRRNLAEKTLSSSSETEHVHRSLVTVTNNPTHHSKLGSPRTLYLNFCGEVIEGRAWNNMKNTASLTAVPFDNNSDPSSFSNAELADIQKIWEIVSEHFAPFDVDVTTERPGSFNKNVGHVMITHSSIGVCENCGGIAYLNQYMNELTYSSSITGNQVGYNYLAPSFCFYDKLSSYANYIAECVTHELGHNLYLGHDGTSTLGYYEGNDWAPIMGVSYYATISQWSKGEYPDANNQEDDLAIISSKLSYRTDDIGSTKALQISGSTGYGEGLIERSSDVDSFTFTGDGSVDIIVQPKLLKHGSLDVGFRLVNAATNSVIVTVEPQNQLTASATLVSLQGYGNYRIEVYGTGNGAVSSGGYSEYASLGHYSVTVNNIVTQEVVCGNGVCQSGENCDNCPQDCSLERDGAICGNGICEAKNGEDCRSCPGDCPGVTKGKEKWCCGENGGCQADLCPGSICTTVFTQKVQYCPNGAEEICGDAIDNDGNGLTDCDDPMCSNHSSCAVSCAAAGELQGACDPSKCCSGQCHKKFNRCN